jgi:Protein of unknown function (DUF3293)
MKEPVEPGHPGDRDSNRLVTEGMSRIPARLIGAYRSAHYRAGSGVDAVVLRVDQRCQPLSRLFSASGQRRAVFITACNPSGMRQSPQQNRTASDRLRERLNQYVSGPDDIIEGMGFNPSEDWPGEESFLVLGLNLEVSRALGDEFQQNALLWADSDAIPRLVLLR